MFGFSIQKLLLLALVVGAVWYGFKWFGRNRDTERDAASGGANAPQGAELIACTACGTYVPESIESCPEGRADCPMLNDQGRSHGARR